MMSDKRNLALLSAAEGSEDFDEPERGIIRDHVPWSRLVAEGKTSYRGEAIPFPGFLIAARERLVLKPGAGYGGMDIHVGRFTPEDECERSVREAVARGGWLVQERVESHPYIFDDGRRDVRPQNVVWGLFCCGSSYGGGYLRMLQRGARQQRRRQQRRRGRGAHLRSVTRTHAWATYTEASPDVAPAEGMRDGNDA